MAIHLVNDLWQELKRYISTVDRPEAADILINLLIDNDHDAEQIRDVFKGDNEVKRALQSYFDAGDEEEFDEDDEDEYDDSY